MIKIRVSFLILFISYSYINYSCNNTATSQRCDSSDIEQVDSCLLGKTIEECIKQLNISPGNFIPHRLFYREIHGIYIRLSDTCKITLVVDNPYIMNDAEAGGEFRSFYKYVLNKKVKGICWRKEKERKVRTIGNVNYAGCMSI